jgi:RNA polymerase sigma factor (sigma-70 family)
MATGSKAVIQQVRTLFQLGTIGGLSDKELLEQFLARSGEGAEDAFAAVVGRHGPMVLRVCRRILTDSHDADDAFQVTFLVLARKAGSIARRELLANWLYGVAVRTAHEVRKSAARRRAREGQVEGIARTDSPPDESADELRLVLDDELRLLPETFRAAIVLCDLEGKTHKEASLLLGVPVGTVSSRVSRGHTLLRQRLARRGMNHPPDRLAAVRSHNAPLTQVPPALIACTARAATRFAIEGTLAGTVPANLISVAEGVLKAMLLAKLTSKGIVCSTILLLSLGAAAVGVVFHISSRAEPAAAAGPPTSARTSGVDWSWVDKLQNADLATRERLKRCASSATANFAAIKTLSFEFNLGTESARVDETTAKTTSVVPAHSRGTLFWKDGSVSYHVEGNFPFRKPYPNGPVFVFKKPKTYSVVRTRDMLAYTEENAAYGLVLTVKPPPQSSQDWEYSTPFVQSPLLDPWLHYASPFLAEQKMLREVWQRCGKIESEESNGKVLLRFLYGGTGGKGRGEVTCAQDADWLPVRFRAGEMRDGKWLIFIDTVNLWRKTDGVWYPSHVLHTAHTGIDLHPVKKFDLTVGNLRANDATSVPDSAFTLSGMKIPDGTGGSDYRYDPPRGLYRAGGIVRQPRAGEGSVPKTIQEMERRQNEESMPAGDAQATDLEPGNPNSGRAGASAGVAAEPGETNREYLTLLEEYEAARTSAEKTLMAVKTEQEMRAAFPELGRVEWSYAGRFLAIARKYRDDPVAIDALGGLVANRFTPPEAAEAAEILIRDHVKSDKLIPLYRVLATSTAAWSTAAERLLRVATDSALTAEARGQACFSLGLLLANRARDLRQHLGPEPNLLLKLEQTARSGGQKSGKSSDENPAALDQEAERFLTGVMDLYSNVSGKNGTLGAMAEPQLFVLRELAVGKPAPEVEGQDVDGKTFRLSEYLGNVVVLTFSGNWCGPCQAMYPHERALVERMRGRPFALVSVNTDEDKETLRKSLESHEITWRCWWEGGAERPNCARWRLAYIPMVYILDARGIIRAKEVRGQAIDDVVDRLVNEMETSSGNPD